MGLWVSSSCVLVKVLLNVLLLLNQGCGVFSPLLVISALSIVCKDVAVTTQYDGQSIKWKLGNFQSAQQYDNYREYIQRCCLFPGVYTLTCINNDKSEGWKNGRLTIQGLDYCNDFMSFRVFRQIIVRGRSLKAHKIELLFNIKRNVINTKKFHIILSAF